MVREKLARAYLTASVALLITTIINIVLAVAYYIRGEILPTISLTISIIVLAYVAYVCYHRHLHLIKHLKYEPTKKKQTKTQ